MPWNWRNEPETATPWNCYEMLRLDDLVQQRDRTMLSCLWFVVAAVLIPALGSSSACQDEPSSSPLIEAIWQEYLPKARLLLKSGAKLNVRDNTGASPLIEAIVGRSSGFAEE